MIYQIRDTEFIKDNGVVAAYISSTYDKSATEGLIRGLSNKDVVTSDMTFEIFDEFRLSNDDKYSYIVLKNHLGLFIIREDNLKAVKEKSDILDIFGIKKLIKAKDKTILITTDNEKYVTTKHKDDKQDLEKALMILLLKAQGIYYRDILKLIEFVE